MSRYSFAKFKNTYLVKKGFNSQTAQRVVRPTNITVLREEERGREHVGLGRTSRTSRANSSRVGERLNLWPSDRWMCEGGRANGGEGRGRRLPIAPRRRVGGLPGVAGRGGQRPSGPTHVRTLRQSQGLIIVDIASYGPHSRPRPSLSRWRAHSVFMFL